MILFKEKYLIGLLYFVLFPLQGQTTIEFYNQSVEEIEQAFIKLEKTKKQKVSKELLSRAKKNNDSLKIAKGYYFSALANSHNEKAVGYLDSVIAGTKKWKNSIFPAKAYLEKGTQLYYLYKNKEALNNLLLASEKFKATKNEFGKVQTLHYIALLKGVAKQYEESLEILEKNILFFEKGVNKAKYENQYLKSLFALGAFYNKLDKLDLAEKANKEGIKKSKLLKNEIYPHFLMSYGTTFLRKGRPDLAIDSIKKGVSLIKNKKKAFCAGLLSINKCLKLLGEEDYKYLLKVDSIYNVEPQVVFYAKEANQKLYDYYKQKNNLEKQLKTVEKLLKIDSLLAEKNQLREELLKKYQIPNLLNEKEDLISKLKEEKGVESKKIILLVVVCLVLIILIISFVRKNQRNKKRYKELILSLEKEKFVKEDVKKEIDASVSIGISEEIVTAILEKLASFEEKKKFVKKNYTLSLLAKELKTNSSYLSKVINSSKGTNFSNYINNLRINYSVNRLKNDKKFRSYTITAIAKESGFNTAQSFTKAFQKKTGLYPSYFIKQLDLD
ncbi:Transcriptional regulator, AraC family [Tenacibaculum sp. 190524A02b]|uniref:Transcriptional regulator, AraC family n=1 Tax=Tenacibaculum vairaonense TaxID=3137860 RepID=A0ABM9PPU3_9FLAO